MARFKISLNMEFCRSADKSFEAGVRIASELGYRWIEPMVHTGWELLSEVNYFHSFSMEEDPYKGLTKVRDRVHHIHAKDISMAHGAEERGKVTGTPVGCACGEGVVDWERVAKIMEPVDREIFLSVECGKIDEAQRSISFLNKTLAKWLA